MAPTAPDRSIPIRSTGNRELLMFTRSKLAALLVLGVSGLLGYAAATGRLAPSAMQPEKTAADKGPRPGDPAYTQPVDGKYLPNPAPKFGGVINPSAKDSKPYWPPQ